MGVCCSTAIAEGYFNERTEDAVENLAVCSSVEFNITIALVLNCFGPYRVVQKQTRHLSNKSNSTGGAALTIAIRRGLTQYRIAPPWSDSAGEGC